MEVNIERKKKETIVNYFSGEERGRVAANYVEKPGAWYFPPLASLITSGGRLLLAMLEKSVQERDGGYLFCDTDSLCIVGSENGDFVECPGELGEKRHLTWVFVSEFGQQITVPTGEVMNFGRNEPATAIKITTESPTPRQILLQDPAFAQRASTLGEEVLDHYRYLKTKDENPMKSLLESKELRPAREHFERSFYWKPGRYTFEISLKSGSSKDKHVQKFEIQLSNADSDRLASNFKLFAEYVSAAILDAEGVPPKYPIWKWVQTGITSL